MRRYIAGRAVIDSFLLRSAHRNSRLRRADIPHLLSPLHPAFDRLVESASAKFHAEVLQRPVARVSCLAVCLGCSPASPSVPVISATTSLDTIKRPYVQAPMPFPYCSMSRATSVASFFGFRPHRGRLGMDRDEVQIGLRKPSRDCRALPEPRAFTGPRGKLRCVTGFRLSHEQARIAFAHGMGRDRSITTYPDVAVPASLTRDRLLSTSLQRRYMVPLEAERDGGATLRQTLRVYYATNRNAASTAAKLGIARQTVAARLRLVESLLCVALPDCATEVELALVARDSATT